MLNTACAVSKPGNALAGQGQGGVLRLAGFVNDSIVDGPGLRCVIFTQGCPHRCPGCHNPATHPFAGGMFATPKELYEKIRANGLCRGVTFSGGEPFAQAQALIPLARLLRAEGYELAAYSGYTWEELTADASSAMFGLLTLLDTLIDGRYVEAQRDLTLRFRGSRNQRILDVQKSLAEGRPVAETDLRWTG